MDSVLEEKFTRSKNHFACRASRTVKVAIGVFLLATLLASASFLLWLGLSWRQRKSLQRHEDPDGQQLLPLQHVAPASHEEEAHTLLGPLGREGAEGSLPELAAEGLPSSRGASPAGQPDVTGSKNETIDSESSPVQDQN